MKLASLALAGLSLAALAVPASAETVKIGVQPWLGYGPLWIADQKGFFKENGVDVQLINFTWDQDVAAALASGNIQVISAATNTVILNMNNGVDLKAFMIMDGSTTADAVLAGKDVAAITDLKGKSVAYEKGSTSDLLINYALNSNGLTIADVEAVPIAAADAGLALIAGRVDVAVTYEPYISAALAQGPDFKVLYTAGEKPGLISDVLAAETSFIAGNQQDLVGIIKAWDEAVTFLRDNPEEGGKIIADAVGSPIEEFNTAFAGVHLYDLAENEAALKGEFQATVEEIGSIMQQANPDEVKTLPTGDTFFDLMALSAAAQ
ncbi:ABC transporter substrate-binding protein [Devosia soli]|uniref:ABC transporter substrate-binding protein n=1 Tax=Devosia soli TaxID=361041 RepID=A0A0F5LDS1_9HYPH|nr:ABC transporter substrate-binding protein [Devosia soli]KKB80344.1 ABC transporter substrate-binding protein [Devosia soli]